MVPVTVIETPEFISSSSKLFEVDERALLVDYLARNPSAGEIMPGTGGMRKLRWALQGRGKRGGARVIYFYYNESVPIFLLTAYAKNELENISQKDRNSFKKLTAILVDQFKGKQK